jgi:hypothetical protein
MRQLILAFAAMTLAVGCGDDSQTASPAPRAGDAGRSPTNRIDVSAAVRQNLGITFATVERRRVASTLRVPGRFELLPTARREYRATLRGFVRLQVAQYERVEPNAPIYRLDSPDWHTLKHELHDAEVGIERATAELAVAERSKTEAEQVAAALAKRVDALAGAEVRRAELETELAAKRASIPRLLAEIDVKRVALEEARHDLEINLARAASLLGQTPAQLTQPENDANGKHVKQRWYAIDQVGLDARGAGVVDAIGATDGSWVEANALVASTIDPKAVRFRAIGLQADIMRLKDGLDATVMPPGGRASDEERPATGKVMLGPVADPQQRTLDLLLHFADPPTWARPGVSSLLEIVVDGSGEPELAIPAAAIVRDGLAAVFFRRDPRDPDKVIRTDADLGTSDGRWVVVKSGVKEGDEVVLDGVYELKLAAGAAGGPTGGGHFHADGTWHAEEDKADEKP